MARHVIAVTVIARLLLEFTGSYGFAASSCPPSGDILPCTCKVTAVGAQVVCKRITSYEALERAIGAMKGYRFESFAVEESNLGRLPSDAFRGLNVRSLRIAFVQPTTLDLGPGPAFTGLENSLEELEIRDSFRFGKIQLPRLELSHLHSLKVLTLDSVEIPVVDNDYFKKGPVGLRQLHLRTTFTNEFGNRAFASLTNLRELSIYQERLKKLTRDMLPTPAHHLYALVLSNNHLDTLSSNVFDALPALRKVDVEFNALNTIDINVWGSVWPQLREANFYGNPIQCDNNIKWIYNQQLPSSFSGNCASPERLRGRELKTLTLSDFE